MLVVVAGISLFTVARTAILPMKLCPPIFRHNFNDDDPGLLLCFHIAIGISNVAQEILSIDDCMERPHLDAGFEEFDK